MRPPWPLGDRRPAGQAGLAVGRRNPDRPLHPGMGTALVGEDAHRVEGPLPGGARLEEPGVEGLGDDAVLDASRVAPHHGVAGLHVERGRLEAPAEGLGRVGLDDGHLVAHRAASGSLPLRARARQAVPLAAHRLLVVRGRRRGRFGTGGDDPDRGLHPGVRRAVVGEGARYVEALLPGGAGLDLAGVEAAVVGGDGVSALPVVTPHDGGPRLDDQVGRTEPPRRGVVRVVLSDGHLLLDRPVDHRLAGDHDLPARSRVAGEWYAKLPGWSKRWLQRVPGAMIGDAKEPSSATSSWPPPMSG